MSCNNGVYLLNWANTHDNSRIFVKLGSRIVVRRTKRGADEFPHTNKMGSEKKEMLRMIVHDAAGDEREQLVVK